MNTFKSLKLISASIILSLASPATLMAEGNRYELPRAYLSEISAAEAYRKMNKNRATLIDVRRLREHAAGHPKKAYNVPFPHIVDRNEQTPSVLYWEVYRIMKGKTHKPIMTLCRTGFRSVLAGNILADPAAYGIEGPAFTNVRNIWEGFVGRYKEPNVDPIESELPTLAELLAHENLHHQLLDLNNDGAINEDLADVYSHTTDMNPDKDGWRNYQALPWNTKISRKTAYQRDLNNYAPYVGEIEEAEEPQ